MSLNQSGSNSSVNIPGTCNNVQRDQDNTFSEAIGTIIRGSQHRTYHADTINFINIGPASAVAEPSVQHIIQAVAGRSNRAPSVATQCPLRSWQRKVIAAADDASGLIASIIRLLENHTEHFDRYRDLELPVELLHHATIMSRLATLEILVPRGRNRTSTVEQAVFECHETLQKLFVKLEDHQDLRVTSIPWNHVPRRFQRREPCRIKRRLETQGILWNHAPRRFQRQEQCRIKKRRTWSL